MAVGLEGRSPFLDHEVMEFAARLPVAYKRQGWEGKRLLKRLARRLVPHEVIDRPKRGFTLPLAGWFRHELADTLRDTLLGDAARRRGWIQPAAVERMVQQHTALTHDWNEQLWILLMLELWAQQFLDRRPQTSAALPSTAPLDADLIGSRH
jgi:asparagine synthase (glutamine-hydrolysing)